MRSFTRTTAVSTRPGLFRTPVAAWGCASRWARSVPARTTRWPSRSMPHSSARSSRTRRPSPTSWCAVGTCSGDVSATTPSVGIRGAGISHHRRLSRSRPVSSDSYLDYIPVSTIRGSGPRGQRSGRTQCVPQRPFYCVKEPKLPKIDPVRLLVTLPSPGRSGPVGSRSSWT